MRGHVDTFESFISDADLIVEIAKKDNPNLPIFMLGHSMGGFIAFIYGLKHGHKLRGQILSASATSKPKESKGFKSKILKFMNMFLPMKRIKNPVARDATELSSVSLNLYVQFLTYGIEHLQKNIGKYKGSCLILHGKKDRVIDIETSLNLYNDISSSDKLIKIYDGLSHDLLKAKDEDVVFEDIHKWLNERVS